jgi:putative ABC transport system permease protein
MAWWSFWHRRRREQDLEDELTHDLTVEVEQRIRAGMTREEAQRSSQREFGNMLSIKEGIRDTWGWTPVERFWQDLRYGLRTMRRTPGVTVVIILTLMLGIGANAVLFSVIYAVLLKPLPYRNPERLVFMTGHSMRFARFDFVDGAEFENWRSQSQSFESMAGFWDARDHCVIGGETVDVGIAYTSENLMHLLGVSLVLGRDFVPEEVSVAGGQPRRVALISHVLFRQRFGGDPSSLGKILAINNVPYLVVGVLPPGLRLALPGIDDPLMGIDVVVNTDTIRARGPVEVLGRLKRGVKFETARAEIETIHAAFSRQHPDGPKTALRIMPLHERIVGSTRLALLVLSAAVGFVLLVACVNVANLLLARAAARGREAAVRAALGASRGRLVRQLLTESITLAFAGGAAGLALAFWGMRFIVNRSSIDIPRMNEAAINWSVLLFCLCVCAITGILSGLAPALSGSRSNLGEMLKEGRAASVSLHRHRLHSLLVVLELAFALVLLTGAGLMLKSLWVIRSQTAAFAPELVLTTNINARQTAQPEMYLGDLANQIEALPGVRAAAAYSNAGRALRIAGLPAPAVNQAVMVTIVRVTPHYAAAAGVRLLSGRWLSEDDRREGPRVTVVNEAVARIVSALYPGSGPIIGKQIDLGGKPADNPTIVGVVSALRWRPDADPQPEVFVPYTWWPLNGVAQYLVRASSDPMALAEPIRKIVGRTPRVEMRQTETAQDQLSSVLAPRRLQALVLVTFAGLALLLAIVGAYGVLSYAVTERTHEIGVRVALGAERGDVLRMVLWRAVRLAGAGVVVGVLASVGLTRFISSLLYGVKSTDPWTYGAVSLLLILVAIFAAYHPARRATRVDPIVALRYE